ncbi:class I SAM-dependent methyltransferase [Microbacterium sp.]|uniref:class I SAM-dependent methyltransferase n=1 Tax=Microbacterium sp. TaxID=51671 RepID=UPI0028124F1F|nr:class I SAM-dependent methyltransferase [Microbacterium sp.]
MADERATSFGAEGHRYESGRPDYPREAVGWMLEPGAPVRSVADVGAGTGKLTRAVAEVTDVELVAVDPDAGMLERLTATSPGVRTLQGTAERLPLPDASVDAVVLGQAWHWVDPAAALSEIGRVVRPGGVLGLIWNVCDERVDWVRGLTAIMHGSPAEEMVAGDGPVVTAPFGIPEERRWEWRRPMTRAQLHDMAGSRSYVITAPQDEKERIAREMDRLFDELGLGEGTIDMPYVTAAYRAVRVG